VQKSYQAVKALKSVSTELQGGKITVFLGVNGSGKSTLMRILAGLENQDKGQICLNGQNTDDKGRRRFTTLVFQKTSMFNRSVYDNLAYGLNIRKVPKEEIPKKISDALQAVHLSGFEKRKAKKLSGGEQQRVSLARAFLLDSKVLLLDEPLGALDLKLRKQMQIELKRLQKKLNITFVYVTHDQEEAMTMSDRIAVINSGVQEQLDTPDQIYKYPKTKFVADFIGESNLFDGTLESVENEAAKVSTAVGEVRVQCCPVEPGNDLTVCVRPEVMKYPKAPVEGFAISGVVKNMIFVGSQYRTLIVLDNGYEVKVNRVKPDKEIKEGARVYLYWDLEDAIGIRDQI
jgi:spermidine/putrescine transport system ATP-binding protein